MLLQSIQTTLEISLERMSWLSVTGRATTVKVGDEIEILFGQKSVKVRVTDIQGHLALAEWRFVHGRSVSSALLRTTPQGQTLPPALETRHTV